MSDTDGEAKITPEIQLEELHRLIDKFMMPFFGPSDGYMELVRELEVKATPEGVITLINGRKYVVRLVPVNEKKPINSK